MLPALGQMANVTSTNNRSRYSMRSALLLAVLSHLPAFVSRVRFFIFGFRTEKIAHLQCTSWVSRACGAGQSLRGHSANAGSA